MSEISKFIPMDENEGNKESSSIFKACQNNKLPAKQSGWSKFKSILFYEIKVELTPHQQKIENEINEFLHQEITRSKFKDFLFQDVTFGKKKTV